jgi:hypothetical protein
MAASSHPKDDRDLLPYVAGSLSDVLEALDRARAATSTALVWVRIAVNHQSDAEPGTVDERHEEDDHAED